MSEDNKAIVRRWVDEMCGQRNLSVGDEIFAADVVDHDPIPGQAPGVEGQKQVLREVFAAFPDFHSRAEEIISEGDRVMLRWTATGTHQGDFFGAKPTGKRITYKGIDSLRIADGKIVERWGVSDDLDLLQQIEAI